MNCPFCKTEMLQGWLNCGMSLWSERKHKISLLPDGEERYALHLGTPLLSPHHVASHCCPKCKRIVVEAAGYENNFGEEAPGTP